jgi:hypothetical protein
LNGVMGMTDLALETQLTPEQREYLDTVTKPIRPQELEEILKDYVSRRMVTAEAVEVAGPHK